MSKAGHITHVWKRRGVCRVLVGRPEEQRPLGRLRRRWEHNSKMDIQKGELWTRGLDGSGSE